MARLFIAVDLAPPVLEQLGVLQRRWDERIGGRGVRVRWVDPKNIHLTLAFLGETQERIVTELESVLRECAPQLEPFDLRCRGVGAFPTEVRPRVLWAGVDETATAILAELHQALERRLEPLGFPPESRPFQPHLTLGRVKSRQTAPMREAIVDLSRFDAGTSRIEEVCLYESELSPQGPKYTARARVPLGRER